MRNVLVAAAMAVTIAAPVHAQMPTPDEWGIEVWTPIELDPQQWTQYRALGGFSEDYVFLSIQAVRLADGESAGEQHVLDWARAEWSFTPDEVELSTGVDDGFPAVTGVMFDEWEDIVVRVVDVGGGAVLRILATSEVSADEALAVLETVEILDPALLRAAARPLAP